MKNPVKPLCSVAIALAMGSPIPAAADMLGTDPCAKLSWNAVMLGDCGIGVGISTELRQSSRDDSDNSTVLVVEVNGVPEPETYALMLAGLVVVAVAARRRRRG